MTEAQIAEIVPGIVRAYNVVDHLEDIPNRKPAALAAFDLLYSRQDSRTLESLMEAFPSHSFLKALTIEDLQPLVVALKEAYKIDVAAHRQTESHEDSAILSAKS